jgi:hypothetical protein
MTPIVSGLLSLVIIGGIVNVGLALYWFVLIRRVRVLHALLARICRDSFHEHHRPVWHAWAQTMGDISVEVRTTQRPPRSKSAPSGSN